MTYKTIIIEKDGPSFIIRFNRPDKRNAISVAMMDEIEIALDTAARDNQARAIIFTGNEKLFSAGVDLNDAMVEFSTPGRGVDFMAKWRRLNASLENHAKPVLCAVEGFCMTGGFELALACDLRIGGEGSQFGLTSAKIGTVPGAGGTQRLPRIVGIGQALDIMFSADPIDAKEAHRIGLLNRLVPKGEALAAAKSLVKTYEERAPLSLKLIKRVVYAGMQMPQAEAIEFEAFVVSTIYQTKDKQEGITSFLEKRKPQFRGE